MKKIKIAQITTEVTPFSKSGGLADVANGLPRALDRQGHDVIIITPLYNKIIDKKRHKLKIVYKNIKVYFNSRDAIRINYYKGYLQTGVPVYFVECKKYFGRKKTLYGSSHENARFLVFNVAALKLLSILKFEADIIQCHDWMTGLIPFYLKTDFRYSKTLRKAKTIFTIHNLIFQFGKNWWEVPPEKKDYGKKRIPHLNDPNLEYINFAKRAILSADAISTVSEQYSKEILTRHFGQDLNRILKNRKDRLFGIVNGISYKDFNPDQDLGLYKKYNYRNIKRKKLNKKYLQKMFKLPQDENMPVIGMVMRISYQKGFDLLFDTIDDIMNLGVQIIIMGGADKYYRDKIKKFIKKYPKQINAHLKFNTKDATKVYAGADIFLMPSHLEPCGITQLIAMRYGSVPIVRHVGGLIDTVQDYNPETKKGNGFVFKNYDSQELLISVVRAVEYFKNKKLWRGLIVRIMQESHSWGEPAKKYVSLYKKVMKFKNGNGKNKKNK